MTRIQIDSYYYYDTTLTKLSSILYSCSHGVQHYIDFYNLRMMFISIWNSEQSVIKHFVGEVTRLLIMVNPNLSRSISYMILVGNLCHLWELQWSHGDTHTCTIVYLPEKFGSSYMIQTWDYSLFWISVVHMSWHCCLIFIDGLSKTSLTTSGTLRNFPVPHSP